MPTGSSLGLTGPAVQLAACLGGHSDHLSHDSSGLVHRCIQGLHAQRLKCHTHTGLHMTLRCTVSLK